MSSCSETISTRLEKVRREISAACERSGRNLDEVRIIGVTKRHPIGTLKSAAEVGLSSFGESYVQEFLEKVEAIGRERVEWHFIGHLQRNKVRQIVEHVDLIHSVDSERLAMEINRQGEQIDRQIPILLQINTSGESSKFGCYPGGAITLAEHISSMEYLRLDGLMTMASFEEDPEVTRPMFKLLSDTRELIADKIGFELRELSMGMSNDYSVAVEEGATMVRIGTDLFGTRE